MNKKLLLAAGILAMASISATEAKTACGAGFNGFYVGMSVGYNSQNAKVKSTTQAATAKATVTSAAQQKTAAVAYQKATDLAAGADAATTGAKAAGEQLTLSGNSGELDAALAVVSLANQPLYGIKGILATGAAAQASNAAGVTILNAMQQKIIDNVKARLEAIGIQGVTFSAPNAAAALGATAITAPAITATYKNNTVTFLSAINSNITANAPTAVELYIAAGAALHNANTNTTLFSDALAAMGDTSFNRSYSETTTINFAETTTAAKANLGKMSFGLNFGYGKSFGMFYVGGGLTGEVFTAGSRVIVPTDTVKKIAFSTPAATNGSTDLSSNMNYASAMLPANTKISLKSKFSFGAELKIGLTSGTWMVYIPVAANMTSYQASFERDTTAIAAFTGSDSKPVSATMTGAYTSAVANSPIGTDAQALYTVNTAPTAVTASTDTTTPVADTGSFKKTKTRFNFAFGLGTQVKLSDAVSLDLRYMFSPTSKMTINTPAYLTGNVADMGQLGTAQVFTLSAHKFSLGCTYHF